MMEKRELLLFKPKLPTVFLSDIFPTINWKKLPDTLSKRWIIQDNFTFLIFTLLNGPFEIFHNETKILPGITNRRSLQAQTQETKVSPEQRSDLTQVLLKQRKNYTKVYICKIAKEAYFASLLTIQRKYWYNNEKVTQVTRQTLISHR